MLADRLRPRSCPLLTPVVCTPVAPAQTVDQRPATNVQGDPDTDKNKKTRREVCARWPPAPALLPAADSRCATLLQRLAMNTFGPTTNNQGYEHYEGFYPNMYKGEVFFCLCCERKNDFVRGIAGPELEELQRTDSFECLAELIKYQGVIERADQFDPQSELVTAIFGHSHPFPNVMDVPKGDQLHHRPSRFFWYAALARLLLKVQEEVKGKRNMHKGRRVQLPECVRYRIWEMYGNGDGYHCHDNHPRV